MSEGREYSYRKWPKWLRTSTSFGVHQIQEHARTVSKVARPAYALLTVALSSLGTLLQLRQKRSWIADLYQPFYHIHIHHGH